MRLLRSKSLKTGAKDHPKAADGKDREFFRARGIVFLEDEWDELMINLLFKCVQNTDKGLYLNTEILKEYSKKYELDFLGVYEILNGLFFKLLQASYKKAEK